MITLLILLFSILWATLLTTDTLICQWKESIGMGRIRNTYSEIKWIDVILFLIWRLINCPLCLSYHIFWISYLILLHSPMGLIYGILAYYLTGYLQKTLHL